MNDNSNLKQSLESLNLNEPMPKAIKYKRSMIRSVVVGVVLIVLISLFMLGGRENESVQENEDVVSFDHISPKIYTKAKQNDSKQTVSEMISEQEIPVEYLPKQVIADRQAEIKPGEHNVGLLQEYFEQQALIKIKEENDARISSLSFAMPLSVDNVGKAVTKNIEQSNNIQTEDYKIVKAGSIIPCVLTTALNSDLPGIIVARVRENVFDSAEGKHLLIPQGAMLVGNYNNNIAFGQERLQIVFNRIDFPPSATNSSGYSVQLEDLPGSDLEGYSGLEDRVNNHYGRVAIGVTLSSLLAATSKDHREYITYRQRAASKASDNIGEIAKKYADKQINQSPTITVRGGAPFNIVLPKDLSLLPV